MQSKPWFIKDRKIKIALVGCGRISKNHLAAIQASEQLELDAICDTNASCVESMASSYGAKGYISLTEMLQHSDADLITLCTPSGLHPAQTIQIANAGRHVITEKPMATRWQDGLAMLNACNEAKVRLFVVKQNRFNKPVQLLKKAIMQQRFGRIYLIGINVFWARPQSYYDQAPWRGTWEFDGGALSNQASHYVDLLHWLGGPVQSVQAMTGTLGRNIETEDTAVLNIKWRHGALGSMAVTMLSYPKNIEGSIIVIGEKGTVKIGGIALNKIEQWEFADTAEEDKKAVMEANYETASIYGFGHSLYYNNVVNVLQEKGDVPIDGREGLKTLELLIAAQRSARAQQIISLPLEL